MGTRCADHVTPLYPQKLALTSPTGGGRSVGIVHVRTKATEFRVYVTATEFTVYTKVEAYCELWCSESSADQDFGMWSFVIH